MEKGFENVMHQNKWIGIAIGTFFAGLGIGLIILQPVSSPMMTGNQMQPMMNNPKSMEQWHQEMMNDPEAMNQWMNTMMQDPMTMEKFHQLMVNNPNHMRSMMSNPDMQSWMLSEDHSKQMTKMMRENHDFMNEIMIEMINDPEIRLQMLGHLSENQEAMSQMRMMVNSTNLMGGNMDHNMMNP